MRISNHCGHARAALQGLGESHLICVYLSAGSLVMDSFNAHKLFRQLTLNFYLYSKLFLSEADIRTTDKVASYLQ